MKCSVEEFDAIADTCYIFNAVSLLVMTINRVSVWLSLLLLSWRSAGYPSACRTISSVCNKGIWSSRSDVDFKPDSAAVSSLKAGSWVKFIAGASNQDLPLIRNMCYLYTMTGVDCIDMSADPAVVIVAKEGVMSAMNDLGNKHATAPLIMISVNDDDDPHFRKAKFDAALCPPECPRPCEKVCPAWAIPPRPVTTTGPENTMITASNIEAESNNLSPGVIADRCYGCGRCVPICPLGLISTESYTVDAAAINKLFSSGSVDAIEIHTLANHEESFHNLWSSIGDEVLSRAKVVSVSFPNMGEKTISYLDSLQSTITSCKSWEKFQGVQIWQADGRPMSGDIGKGTAHKSSNLASYVLQELEKLNIEENTSQIANAEMISSDRFIEVNKLNDIADIESKIDVHGGFHFVQLAGGTNNYSAKTAENEGLLGAIGFGGFAFGGYARKKIGEILHELEDLFPGSKIEDHPEILKICLEFAENLVNSVKVVDRIV